MFKILLKSLGYVSRADVVQEINYNRAIQRVEFNEKEKRQEETILALRTKTVSLQTEVDRLSTPRPVINIDQLDPDGVTDRDQRKLYVGTVAGFHKEYLKPKLLNIIAAVREDLEKPHNEKMSDFLRGTANALWLLHDWGESMINEQVSNQNADVSSEDVESLKKIIS